MKVWVVTKEEDGDGEQSGGPLDVFVAVCATQMDALAAIEADGGAVIETRALNVRYSIGKRRWSDEVDPTAVTLEAEYARRTAVSATYWSPLETWHVREVEIAGFDRDAALEAIKQHDYARGWRVEFDTDHVNAVSNRD